MSDELDNILETVKRDAVREARAGSSAIPASGAGLPSIGGTSSGATPTTFKSANGSLHPFKLDEDDLPPGGETALAYLW